METFSPRNTFALLLVMFMIIGMMYLMSDVLHIESYREDHHIGVEEDHSITKSSGPQTENHNSKAVKSQPRQGEGQPLPSDADVLFSDSLAASTEILVDSLPTAEAMINEEDYFDQLIESYKKTTLAELPETENRTDLVVRYYPHPPDEGRVEVLGEYGYYLHERPVDDSNADYKSNSIFFGDKIKSEDIQIIAYLLIKNGVAISQIKPSRYHDGWKANSIEIGTDRRLNNSLPLTFEAIKRFSNPNYGK